MQNYLNTKTDKKKLLYVPNSAVLDDTGALYNLPIQTEEEKTELDIFTFKKGEVTGVAKSKGRR